MMKYIHMRTITTLALLCLLIGVLIGTGAAQEGLDVSVDTPTGVTEGDQATISASITVPEVTTTVESELTVTFYVDGEQVGSETVTVTDGETTQIEQTHTFTEAGETSVTVEAEITLAGQSFSGSASGSVDVAEPSTPTSTPTATPTPTPIPTLEEPTVTEVPTATIPESPTVTEVPTVETTDIPEGPDTPDTPTNISLQTGTTSATGVSFAVPASLEDEVQQYRDNLAQEPPAHTFVLATEDELYIVFSQQEPTTGLATVSGVSGESNVSGQNLTYGVIVASETSFETTGTNTTVQDIISNPDEYHQELVRVTSHYRSIATLTDPDQGNNLTVATTAGFLTDTPANATTLFDNPGRDAAALSQNNSSAQVDAILNNSSGERLHTFSFQTRFWTNGEATVDGIVLNPDSAATQFVQEYDQTGITQRTDSQPALYIINRSLQTQSVENVSSISSQSEELDGTVVETEVRLYQQQVSVQETLEHSTGCNEDVMQIQTPQGPVCTNVPQDSVLHGGVAWNGVPQSTDDALLVMGVSSIHQDSPQETVQGRYQIVGEVVSTSRLNDSLPEGSILLIYELERQGDIDYTAMANETRTLIENRSSTVSTQLQSQVNASVSASAQAGTESEQATSAVSTTGADGSGFTIVSVLLSVALFVGWRYRL